MTTIALNLPTYRRRKGFGLLEVILVFALVIAAAAGTFAVFQSANASSNAATVTEQVNTVIANLRTSPWGMAHDYTTMPLDALVTAHLAPPSMIQGGQAVTPYGPIVVAPWYNDPRQFDINFNHIPDLGGECSKVIAGFGAMGLDDIWVAGSGPSDTGGSVYTNGKLDMTKVAHWCSGLNTSDASVGMDLVGH
ncbi:MAG: hypothetical protein BGP10_13315 [Rhodanobacter sp. 68-29]|nr:type II secretion system protein [Rhodanobacter sp.]ODU92223.1 MAG: hypothetical protein ABT18_13165 [Rhodanobacter sp. SCN 66-43]OJY58304.1 MAG: hypothetical protein BGP10_13315 [Rhodanobacter sp. 68-29]